MAKKKRAKSKSAKKNVAAEEAAKSADPNLSEPPPARTFEEYQCLGNVEVDFPKLCAFLDVKDVAAVWVKRSVPAIDETEEAAAEQAQPEPEPERLWSTPCLYVELEDDDPLQAKSVKLSGWRVDDAIVRALNKMFLSLSRLQSLQFWQAGLTHQMIESLVETFPLCTNLRVVSLEGNPLPEQSYHLLLSKESPVTHLSLRNNRIGEEGARLLAAALSPSPTANRTLWSLNLAFNCLGDAGAAHIAKALRLNRSLMLLSLSHNHIGDPGAAPLAELLSKFPLTHEEVVERRKLLWEGMNSSSADAEQSSTELAPSAAAITTEEAKVGPKKKEAPKREATKDKKKKAADQKAARGRGGRPAGKQGKSSPVWTEECPLLDLSLKYRNGNLYLPGNKILTSLNLSGNKITEKSLPLFLSSLEMQGEGGLLRLCLQRNHFPPECETYVKITELMTLKDPLNKDS